jgi:hypothetical protein
MATGPDEDLRNRVARLEREMVELRAALTGREEADPAIVEHAGPEVSSSDDRQRIEHGWRETAPPTP